MARTLKSQRQHEAKLERIAKRKQVIEALGDVALQMEQGLSLNVAVSHVAAQLGLDVEELKTAWIRL